MFRRQVELGRSFCSEQKLRVSPASWKKGGLMFRAETTPPLPYLARRVYPYAVSLGRRHVLCRDTIMVILYWYDVCRNVLRLDLGFLLLVLANSFAFFLYSVCVEKNEYGVMSDLRCLLYDVCQDDDLRLDVCLLWHTQEIVICSEGLTVFCFFYSVCVERTKMAFGTTWRSVVSMMCAETRSHTMHAQKIGWYGKANDRK